MTPDCMPSLVEDKSRTGDASLPCAPHVREMALHSDQVRICTIVQSHCQFIKRSSFSESVGSGERRLGSGSSTMAT
jgi:hypothetical protein